MNAPLHNQTGADAYNAVAEFGERRRNPETDQVAWVRPMRRAQILNAALIWIIFMSLACWLCTDAGIVFMAEFRAMLP
jgi:hypothetical protein